MKYNPHKPGNMFYLNGLGTGKTSIAIRRGNITVQNASRSVANSLKQWITKKLGTITPSMEAVEKILNSSSDDEAREFIDTYDPVANADLSFIQPITNKKSKDWNNKSNRNLFAESRNLDPATIKFCRKSTVNNLSIYVDYPREPKELLDALRESIIPSENIIAKVAPFDIIVIDEESGNELVIERKTVTDLNASIKTGHVHTQVERYFEYAYEASLEGKTVRVMWIIEGEAEKDLSPLMALNGLPQLTGLVSYDMMISDQFLHYTHSTRETAYAVVKFAQGFFERRLQQKVVSGKYEMRKKIGIKSSDATLRDDSGSYRKSTNLKAQLMYIDGVTTKTAESLAATGKSFAQIVQMSADELILINGIGPKSAERIYQSFNLNE